MYTLGENLSFWSAEWFTCALSWRQRHVGIPATELATEHFVEQVIHVSNNKQSNFYLIAI